MVAATLPIDTAVPSEEARLADVTQAVRLLRGVLRHPVPGGLSGDTARQFVSLFSEAERAAASGVALFAPVVLETGDYTKEGHGSAADWLGSLSGSSSGAAKGRLAAAARAAKDPLLTEALHEGELSAAQLALVTSTSAEVPDAAGDLLELMEQGASHQEVSDAASRMRAAKRSLEDEKRRRARVHTNRYFRWGQDEGGGIRGGFFCDEVEFARIAPRLEAEATRRWKAAGNGQGGGDSLEAHRLDAFIDLMSGSGDGGQPDGGGRSPGPGPGPRPRTLIIVNAESLRRGTTEGDETCEIEGIGPVSVAAATELLSEASLRFVIREGFDIKTVTKSTRDVAACIEAALIVRDRTCARPGCGKRFGLETDHREVDFGDDGPTELDNLVRLCPQCHDLKTYGGWRLEGEPGAWKWIAPAHPKSAGYIARARKLAAAKGRARAARQRNFPRRD